MPTMNYDNFIRSLNMIRMVMGSCRVKYDQIKWFLSFGSLLGIIRDGGLLKDEQGNIKETEDIDISVLYEESDENTIIRGFEKFGYQTCRILRNDVTRKPFHYGFRQPVNSGNPNSSLPEICVFAWYLHKGIRYHTYDVGIEKKEVPSEYVFKGAPDELFKEQADLTMKTPIDGMYGVYHVPAKYGSLLDIWYPDWLKKRPGVSESKYMQKMKSCAEWGKL